MCLKKENNPCCCALTIISALIGAIAIAAIYFAGVLTSVTAIIYLTLILGILGFLYVIITNICGKRNCKIINKLCLVPTIVGSIVIPVFALVVTALPIASESIAILIGALAFFMFMSLFNVLYLIFSFFCLNKCDD